MKKNLKNILPINFNALFVMKNKENKYELKLGKKKAQWTRIEPIGFPPPGRWLHTADVIQSDVRVLLCWWC